MGGALVAVTFAMVATVAMASESAPKAGDQNSGTESALLLPPGPDNKRNSEGDIIQLKDGRLMLVYTHFMGGGEDESPAILAARYSSDGGRTWTGSDTTVVGNEGKQNVMSVTLRRLRGGEIGLFYLRKDSDNDCRPILRRSRDEGKTWGPPQYVVSTPGYYVLNNDRVVILRSGRIVAPMALHQGPKGAFVSRARSLCYLSDDGGRTWRQSKTVLDLVGHPRNGSGLQEPAVVELRDGRLLMLCRTDLGTQYTSVSTDGGDTWSPVQPGTIRSPLAPASVKRIPRSGDLLLVWNDNYDPKAGWSAGNRTPLAVAVSHDDGRTWGNRRVIYDDPDGWYCYTSITFVGKDVLLSHCAGSRKTNGLGTLQVTRFPIGWVRSSTGRG